MQANVKAQRRKRSGRLRHLLNNFDNSKSQQMILIQLFINKSTLYKIRQNFVFAYTQF